MNSSKNETSNSRHPSSIIRFWAEKALSETKLTKTAFYDAVSQHDSVTHVFKALSDHLPSCEYTKIEQANHIKVRRYLDGTISLPIDLIEAWLSALPHPHQSLARVELASKINPSDSNQTVSAMNVIRELAEGIEALTKGEPNAIKKELGEAIDSARKFLGVF